MRAPEAPPTRTRRCSFHRHGRSSPHGGGRGSYADATASVGEAPMTGERGGEDGVALPVGTVTLLLADVEGSTRLWEAEPEIMTKAVARLDEVVAEAVGCHGGVRPVEQGEGDSFVAAFARASDAVAAALDLQRADTAPIRLRIGIHTGEVQLRDEGNYIGPAINRAARLRDIGHGGQILVSHAARDLV